MNELLTHSIQRSVWWGWGDPAEAHPLSPSAWKTIEKELGVSRKPQHFPPVTESNVQLPDSRLPDEDLAALRQIAEVLDDRSTRIEHAAGKSYPDIYRLRHGIPESAPDAVAFPGDAEEVAELLQVCSERDIAVVPFGGGTSVVGGVTVHGASRPCVSIDLRKMDRVLHLDRFSRTATMQPGLRGPDIERALHRHGLTLGHYPQSHQEATLGGYLASRSSGQASTGYGRPDERVIGLRMATPTGELRLGGLAPASAAGPRLIDLAVGSEGALGIITEATLALAPLPTAKIHQAWAFPSLADGAAALRQMSQDLGHGWIPDVCRLSDAEETWVNLTLAGRAGRGISRYLKARKYQNPCLLIAVWEGDSVGTLRKRARRCKQVLKDALGVRLPSAIAKAWEKGRFAGPYLRDELMGHQVLAETLETATTWDNLPRLHDAVRDALRGSLTQNGSSCIVMGHLSHIYPTGSSLYYTFIAPETDEPLEQWRSAKAAACAAIMANGGTISHHHAVGSDHRPYLTAEIGDVGAGILRAVKAEVDPKGIMNPGKLIP